MLQYVNKLNYTRSIHSLKYYTSYGNRDIQMNIAVCMKTRSCMFCNLVDQEFFSY